MVSHRQRVQARNHSIYSHYASPQTHHQTIAKKSAPRNGPALIIFGFIFFIVFVLGSITYANISQHSGGGIFGIASKSTSNTGTKLATNACAGNTKQKELVVVKTKLQMWACNYETVVHNAPVVVGMEMYAADKTPAGTYHIEQKQRNISLIGSDSNGSWNDHVDYWLQFLQNQYGKYGFHDAQWRSSSQFGHVSMNAPFSAALHGSRGCVETPLAAMKWIYDWTPVGTTVVIKA